MSWRRPIAVLALLPLLLVELLLRSGAAVTAQRDDGVTALMGAARIGHLPTVEVLLAQGADVKLSDRTGTTALAYAQQAGRDDVARRLQAAGAAK